MSTPAPHVVPLFATPFGVVSLPGAQTLNPALAALFAERATAQWRDPLAPQGALTFRSRADLTDWPEEPVFVVASSGKHLAIAALIAQDPNLIAWRAVQGCPRVELWVHDANATDLLPAAGAPANRR